MVKKAIFYTLLLGIGIALFVDVLLETGVSNIWTALKEFSLLYFLAYFGVQFVNVLVLTWRWKYILAHYGEKVSYWKLILHRYAGWAISFLTPSAQVGGDPIRVVLLKKEGVEHKHAVFSVVVDKALQVSGALIFIFMGFVTLLSMQLISRDFFVTFGVGLSIGFLILFWFYYSSVKHIGFFTSILKALQLHRIKRFQKTFNKVLIVEDAIRDFYKGHWGKFLWLLIFSVITEAYEMIDYWLIGHFMGVNFSFYQVFLIRSLPCITFLLPIPGALGALEKTHMAIFALLGININVFVFVLITRIRDLINVAIGLIHLSANGISAVSRYFISKFGTGWFRKRYPKLFG